MDDYSTYEASVRQMSVKALHREIWRLEKAERKWSELIDRIPGAVCMVDQARTMAQICRKEKYRRKKDGSDS